MKSTFTTLLLLLLLPFVVNTLARQNRTPPLSLPADTSIVCTDTTLHLLLIEDTLAITAGHITKTRDGNILIPAYCHPDKGFYYTLPYLIKCTPAGKVVWSNRYTNTGSFPSNWISAYSVAELNNGDLLLTGQIGVPGTDDRRELAVWRLDGKGNLLWSASYASTLWTNPITGATAITGIREDAEGNIFLAGDNKLFEASKLAFILKLDAKGAVLWDNDYAGNSIFSYGVVLLQNKLLLIGGIDPSNATDTSANNELWCLQLNPDNGHLLVSKAWLADFGSRSAANSFYYANTSVILLDNGQISVQGTAHADYLGLFASRPGNINHSIIAHFSPDLTFQSGILLGSARASNYYNTVASQQENGRTSFARVVENNNLYNEDIVYGHLQPDGQIKERIYHENNRSIQATSNFLFFPPGEDIIVQSFWDSTAGKGGLELLRLRDEDRSIVCNGKDTSISFILPYAMKTSAVQFDAIIANTFYSTDHNTVSSGEGHLAASSACRLAGAKLDGSPIVSLNQDSVLCQGSTRQLIAGDGGHDHLPIRQAHHHPIAYLSTLLMER